MSWGWIFLIVWTLWAAYHFKYWYSIHSGDFRWFAWPIVFVAMYAFAPFCLGMDLKWQWQKLKRKFKEWKK